MVMETPALKHQIENAHHLGLSVSYDRVMDVNVLVAHAVCKRHVEEGWFYRRMCSVLSSPHMMSTIWTATRSGNLSRGDFHGICITVTNHLSKENSGIRRPPIILDQNTKSKPKLPDRYIIVPPVVIKNDAKSLFPEVAMDMPDQQTI